MEIFADLHIHSRFSRATSKSLNLDNLEKYARVKGINLLGTGDFTHPLWFKELKQNLREENGILKTKTGFNFLLQTEISLMYKQDYKMRKIHLLLLAPSFEIVEQITAYLKQHGRVDYDGRPIFNITCYELVEKIKEISDDIEIIPAHVWTPWFGLFGSKSGFNTVEEAFKDKANKIYALETGLSSDPEMNWMLSKLDNFTLVSFSDLHSYWPWRLGREATVFELKELSYKEVIKAIRKNKIKETIEVDPSYGKYHYDGHRFCNVSMEPKQAIRLKNICPVCKKELTIGVLHRVLELADRPYGFKPKNAKPFKRLLPLSELISKTYNIGLATKKTWEIYYKLVNKERSELYVLLNFSFEEIKDLVGESLARAIINNREGRIKIKPGYDGVYGVALIGQENSQEDKTYQNKRLKKIQKSLDDF